MPMHPLCALWETIILLHVLNSSVGNKYWQPSFVSYLTF
uniref:Uncharacterized protein n=1 Tax=Anguilla anguilla TaxID=7936 RepID=A0A0E9REM3_ANGAN